MKYNEEKLFGLCKKGDLGQVRRLIEIEDVDLNLRDKWDSTPLYYACLCGHIELVQYLLSRGARCEANTFDGERCQYGALTDQIRNVLRSFKINTIKLDHYDFFLERLFELGAHSDIVFDIKGRNFKAHKVILSARCAYFKRKFETIWKNKTFILGSHELLEPEAFAAVLKYIYTGRFSTHKSNLEAVINVIKTFKLNDLMKQLELKYDYILLKEVTDKTEENKERDEFYAGKFGSDSKITNILTIESPIGQLKSDFRNLVDEIITTYNSKTDLTHDLCLKVKDEHVFKVHKAFIAERCDYFKTFLNDPFSETQTDSTVQTIDLNDITEEVLTEIVYFIYSDSFSSQTLDECLLYEVLVFSDMYLLPSLKRKCASELATQTLNKDNVFNLFNLARLYDLKKLEAVCISFIARNLLQLENVENLKEIIKSDAAKLTQRQETDTIVIVDELRHEINEKESFLANIEIKKEKNGKDLIQTILEREMKLDYLDKILQELGLEC